MREGLGVAVRVGVELGVNEGSGVAVDVGLACATEAVMASMLAPDWASALETVSKLRSQLWHWR